MPTYRYPVLLLRDGPAAVTGFVIDTEAAAFGTDAADVKEQLKAFLEWHHKGNHRPGEPDVTETKLLAHTVTVRPEYRAANRIQPCERAVKLKLPCVLGVRASGQKMAELPTLGLRFDYADDADVHALLERYALQRLSEHTPADLVKHLTGEPELLWLPVRVPVTFKTQASGTVPPTLGQISEPLADRSARAGFAKPWQREEEVAGVIAKLLHEKDHLLLVGDGGVGKTTVLADAVKQAEDVLSRAKPKGQPTQRRCWISSAGRIVSGMKYLGQWEERVEAMIAELSEIEGILCVDRLLDLVRRGGRGPADSIAAFLMPYMSRGQLRVVGEATPSELEACRRLLPGFADLFQQVRIDPMDRAKAQAAIGSQLDSAAAGKSITIEDRTNSRIVQLFRRFQPYAVLPGPAAVFARSLVNSAARRQVKSVGPADVTRQFRDRTGLPEQFLNDDITMNADEVRGFFNARVLDQPAACEAAANAVLTVKAGLNDPKRPLSVMLFCGPTGVGKTLLAQSLAEYFFGHSESAKKPGEVPLLLRFDMSEYGGFDAVHRLLGGDEPGELIRRVRQQPFCVLLLDEIEKAADPVFDALMGLLDEGRLTDPYGRETVFRSAVVIMTSNLGARRDGVVGFEAQSRGGDYSKAVKAFFRPEFFNRLDAVVPFDPLKPDAVKRIAKRELDQISNREGLDRRGLTIRWSEAVVDHIAAVGCDARYGARPMQRAVERIAVAALAKWLLSKPLTNSGTIQADWISHELQFTMIDRA